MMSPWWGPARLGLPPRSMRRRRACRFSSSTVGASGVRRAPARIENYFGFPTGITGQELAGRGFTQAQKVGADLATPAAATRLNCRPREAPGPPISLVLEDGRTVSTRTVVIASGVRYRRPSIPALGDFEGRGVSYW